MMMPPKNFLNFALSFWFLIFGFCIFTGCGNNASAPGKTLVEINSHKITEGDLEFLASLNPNIAAQLATPFGKKQILDNLVEQDLLYHAARKEGIDHDPKVQAKIDLYKKVILAQAFIENNSSKEAQKYYDEHKNEFEQLKMSQILIRFATPEELKASKKSKTPETVRRTEKEALALANQIYDKLKNGGDFAALAKEYTEDPINRGEGGNLGFVSREDPRLSRRGMVPLVEKSFTMKVGEIAGPIKTTNGYSIITVTQPAEQLPFAEVKNQILFKLRGELRSKILAGLKSDSKIVYAKEFDAKPETAPTGEPTASPHGHEHGHEHPHEQAPQADQPKQN